MQCKLYRFNINSVSRNMMPGYVNSVNIWHQIGGLFVIAYGIVVHVCEWFNQREVDSFLHIDPADIFCQSRRKRWRKKNCQRAIKLHFLGWSFFSAVVVVFVGLMGDWFSIVHVSFSLVIFWRYMLLFVHLSFIKNKIHCCKFKKICKIIYQCKSK